MTIPCGSVRNRCTTPPGSKRWPAESRIGRLFESAPPEAWGVIAKFEITALGGPQSTIAGARVIFELIEDLAKLALVVACLYFVLGTYVRRSQPVWSEPLEKRRVTILWVLVLAVSAVKVSEDVLGGESGPIDRAILLF